MLTSEEARLVASYLQGGGRILVCPTHAAEGVKSGRYPGRRRLPKYGDDGPSTDGIYPGVPIGRANSFELAQAEREALQANASAESAARRIGPALAALRARKLKGRSAAEICANGTLARYAWRAILRFCRGAPASSYGFSIRKGG